MTKPRMPAEWEPHEACIILYPHNPATFCLEKVRPEVINVARAIARSEKVYLLTQTATEQEQLLDKLQNDTNIIVQVCESNDTWARDTAPTFVQSKNSIIGLDWNFNGYGGPKEGCYWPCDKDQKVASRVCELLGVDSLKVPLVLEGGSIHTDGEGTLLTTEECLLNKNRNPDMTKEEIESLLLNQLGCEKVIWLKEGLAYDDDTNGHIDNWACFSEPGHVILAWTDDKESDPENYARCRESLSVLESSTDAKGRRFVIHKLQLPRPTSYTKEEVERLLVIKPEEGTEVLPRSVGERVACSYVNFYIANRSIVVPQYGAEEDQQALETLQTIFKDREVVGVHSKEIALGGGNIHCITQQVPMYK